MHSLNGIESIETDLFTVYLTCMDQSPVSYIEVLHTRAVFSTAPEIYHTVGVSTRPTEQNA